MILQFIRSHHLKILAGAPIIFLVLVNVGPSFQHVLALSTEAPSFIEVGSTFEVHVMLHTDAAINAVGGVVKFSPHHLEMLSLDRQNSVVSLWSEEPSYSNNEGSVQFSGGILQSDSDTSQLEKKVFTMLFRTLNPGPADISILDPQILAHDGLGTNLAQGTPEIRFVVRAPHTASPDVNRDGVVSLLDVNTLYIQTYRSYDPDFDLNADNKVSWADVRALLEVITF
jgi:hypothetical protein